MNTLLFIWLAIFGAVLIASFWMGTYYLSEWKDALVKGARYEVRLKHQSESGQHMSDSDCAELASYKIQGKISVIVWIVSFFFTLLSLAGVFWTLVTKIF